MRAGKRIPHWVGVTYSLQRCNEEVLLPTFCLTGKSDPLQIGTSFSKTMSSSLSPHAKPFLPRRDLFAVSMMMSSDSEKTSGNSAPRRNHLSSTLPAEIYVKIFAFLDLREASRLARTCRYIQYEVWSGKTNGNRLWWAYCERDWRDKYFLEKTKPRARDRETYRRVLLDSRRQIITHEELTRMVFHLRFFTAAGDLARFNTTSARPFPVLLRRFAPEHAYW